MQGACTRGGTCRGHAPEGGTCRGHAPEGGTCRGHAPEGGTCRGHAPEICIPVQYHGASHQQWSNGGWFANVYVLPDGEILYCTCREC